MSEIGKKYYKWVVPYFYKLDNYYRSNFKCFVFYKLFISFWFLSYFKYNNLDFGLCSIILFSLFSLLINIKKLFLSIFFVIHIILVGISL